MCDPTVCFRKDVEGKVLCDYFFLTLFQHPNSLYLHLTFPQSSDEFQPFSYLQAIWKVTAHTLCSAQYPGDLILIL